jgi:hypothetical protein
MEIEYATLEQSAILKSKGFIEPVRIYLDKRDGINSNNITDRLSYLNHNNRGEWSTSIPEQWQIVKWASLVYNIDIEARPVRYAGDLKTSYYQPYINGSVANLKRFDTKQEALSNAIDEFLKQI